MKARLILSLLMSSVMVFMVTLLVTYLNLGLVPDFLVPVGQGLCHRLAGRGRDRVHDHAGLPPPDRPHRRAPGADGLMLSALDLARRIEAGALTPRAVVEMCAEAIAARESEIGAFTALDIEGARRTADGLASMPLRGLPVGMKDIFDTVDFPTAYGSPIYAGHRPKADAAMVMAVRRAGGVILGKTVTTEFASLQPAGTRNPRNPAHTPGGSSSGSAAAIAAGMLPIAFGSQTGGSVIRPAAYCGVAGYKPSFRLLPTVGMKTFSWSLDTVGRVRRRRRRRGVRRRRHHRPRPADRRRDAQRAVDRARAHASVVGSDARHAGRGRARGARRRSRRRARRPSWCCRRSSRTRSAATASCRTTKPIRALAYEYDRHRDRLGPILARAARQGRRHHARINTTKRGAPPGGRGRPSPT